MKRFAMLLTAAACLSACDSADDAPAGLSATATPATGTSVGYAQKYADTAPTFDAQLNAVSLENPGFKGIVGSEDGTEIIVLVDQASAQRGGSNGLAADLASRLGLDAGALSFETAAAVQGKAGAPAAAREDFHVLYDAKNGLRRFMFESDLVSYLDLDETTGRVVVGTHTGAQEAAVRSAMTPDELAVSDFIRSPEFVNAVGTDDAESEAGSNSLVGRSLRFDAFRPLVAGGRTHFRNASNQGSFCTQGPAVSFNGSTYGFLSNAHCTLDRTRVDGVRFYQPQPLVAADLIGIETAEPTYRSGIFITDGYYSDAAFIRTQTGIQLKGQMTSADNCFGAGDCVENGIITNVSGTATYLPVNAAVFKTGNMTGTTAGRISQTCFDTVPTGESRQILCSSVVSYSSTVPSPTRLVEGGDSGSAVLVNGGVPGTTSAALAGILWGGRVDGSTFAFSPWENIWQGAGRAGTAYGLPVQVITGSQTVSNASSTGGGSTGGGSTGGGGTPGGGGCPDTGLDSGGGWSTTREQAPCNP